MLGVDESASGHGSMQWRLQGWVSLLQETRSSREVLVGQPYGGSLMRYVDNYRVDTAVHSFYLAAFFRFGLVGVMLIVLAAGRAGQQVVKFLGSRDPNVRLRAASWAALLLVQLISFVSYEPNYEWAIVAASLLAVQPWHVAGGVRRDRIMGDRVVALPDGRASV
jgi:hypothetical protein